MQSDSKVCSRCGVRPAQFYPVAVLGSLQLSERPLCEECDANETRQAMTEDPPKEGDFSLLGPIHFDTLLGSLNSVGTEPPEQLAWYAARIREIARAHAQEIPSAIDSYLRRFEASGHTDTA